EALLHDIPYHGGCRLRPCGLATVLAERFPRNLAAFYARDTLSSKSPEPPRKASNLSPKPSPKRTGIGVRDRDWQRSAEPKAGRSSFVTDGLCIEESRLAVYADAVDEARHTAMCGTDRTRRLDCPRRTTGCDRLRPAAAR